MNLVVISGLPGTGKSTLAEALAKELRIPVFAKDWLEATLLRAGLTSPTEDHPLGFAAYELMSMLAERQLRLGQSAILDSVAATPTIRNEWRQLADKYRAGWRVIECICTVEEIQRARLRVRQRDIPGWHELDWSEVERVRRYYSPWQETRLILDLAKPFEENLRSAVAYCEG